MFSVSRIFKVTITSLQSSYYDTTWWTLQNCISIAQIHAIVAALPNVSKNHLGAQYSQFLDSWPHPTQWDSISTMSCDYNILVSLDSIGAIEMLYYIIIIIKQHVLVWCYFYVNIQLQIITITQKLHITVCHSHSTFMSRWLTDHQIVICVDAPRLCCRIKDWIDDTKVWHLRALLPTHGHASSIYAQKCNKNYWKQLLINNWHYCWHVRL